MATLSFVGSPTEKDGKGKDKDKKGKEKEKEKEKEKDKGDPERKKSIPSFKDAIGVNTKKKDKKAPGEPWTLWCAICFFF